VIIGDWDLRWAEKKIFKTQKMRKAPGGSDDVMIDLKYAVVFIVMLCLCKSVSGFTFPIQLYLCMFTFEYACGMAFVYTLLEVAVTVEICSEVKCVF
jgi:hypothetical protein